MGGAAAETPRESKKRQGRARAILTELLVFRLDLQQEERGGRIQRKKERHIDGENLQRDPHRQDGGVMK